MAKTSPFVTDDDIRTMLTGGSSPADVLAHILRTQFKVGSAYSGADNSIYFGYGRDATNPDLGNRFVSRKVESFAEEPAAVGVGGATFYQKLVDTGQEKYKGAYSGYRYAADVLAQTYHQTSSEAQFNEVYGQLTAANTQTYLARTTGDNRGHQNPELAYVNLHTKQYQRNVNTMTKNTFTEQAKILARQLGVMLNPELGGDRSAEWRDDMYNLSPMVGVGSVGKAKQEKLLLRASEEQWSLMPGQTIAPIGGNQHVVSRFKMADPGELVGAGGGMIMAAEPYTRSPGTASAPILPGQLAGFHFGGNARSWIGENADIGYVLDSDGNKVSTMGQSIGGAAEIRVVPGSEEIQVGYGPRVVQALTEFFDSPDIKALADAQKTAGGSALYIGDIKSKIKIAFGSPLLKQQTNYQDRLKMRNDVLQQMSFYKTQQAATSGDVGKYNFTSTGGYNDVTAQIGLDVKTNAAYKGFTIKSAPSEIRAAIGKLGLTGITGISEIKNKFMAGQSNKHVWQEAFDHPDTWKSYLLPQEMSILDRMRASGKSFEQAYKEETPNIAKLGTLFLSAPKGQELMREPRTNSGTMSGGDLLSMYQLGNDATKHFVVNMAKAGYRAGVGSIMGALTNQAVKSIEGPIALPMTANMEDAIHLMQEQYGVGPEQAVKIGGVVIPGLRAIGNQGGAAAAVLKYLQSASPAEMAANAPDVQRTVDSQYMGKNMLKESTSIEVISGGGLLRYLNPDDKLFKGEHGQDTVYLGRRDVTAIANGLSRQSGTNITEEMVLDYMKKNDTFGEFSGFPRRGGPHIAKYKLYEGKGYENEFAGSSSLWALEQFRDSDYDRALQHIGLQVTQGANGNAQIAPVEGGKEAFMSQRDLEGRMRDSLAATVGPAKFAEYVQKLRDETGAEPTWKEILTGAGSVKPLAFRLPQSKRDQNVYGEYHGESGVGSEQQMLGIMNAKSDAVHADGTPVTKQELAQSYLEQEDARSSATVYGATKTAQFALSQVDHDEFNRAARANNPAYDAGGIDPFNTASMYLEWPYQEAIDFEQIPKAIREAIFGSNDNPGMLSSDGMKGSPEAIAAQLVNAYLTTSDDANMEALAAIITPDGRDLQETMRAMTEYNQNRSGNDRMIDIESRQHLTGSSMVKNVQMHQALTFFKREMENGASDADKYQKQRSEHMQFIENNTNLLGAAMVYRRSALREDFWPTAQPTDLIGMIMSGNRKAGGVPETPDGTQRTPEKRARTDAHPSDYVNKTGRPRILDKLDRKKVTYIGASSAQGMITDRYGNAGVTVALNAAIGEDADIQISSDSMNRGSKEEELLEDYLKAHPGEAIPFGHRVLSKSQAKEAGLTTPVVTFQNGDQTIKSSVLHDFIQWDGNTLTYIDQKTGRPPTKSDAELTESYQLQQSIYANGLSMMATEGVGDRRGAKAIDYLTKFANFELDEAQQIVKRLQEDSDAGDPLRNVKAKIYYSQQQYLTKNGKLNGRWHDLSLLSAKETAQGLGEAADNRQTLISDITPELVAHANDWVFDDDHNTATFTFGNTTFTLTPKGGKSVRELVDSMMSQTSELVDYERSQEKKTSEAKDAEEEPVDISTPDIEPGGGGSGDGGIDDPVDISTPDAEPGRGGPSSGPRIHRVYRSNSSGSKRNWGNDMGILSQIIEKTFTPEGLTVQGAQPTHDPSYFQMGSDAQKVVAGLANGMSGRLPLGEVREFSSAAFDLANVSGMSQGAIDRARSIAQNVSDATLDPSNALFRRRTAQSFSQTLESGLATDTKGNTNYMGGVIDAETMEKVSREDKYSSRMNYVLRKLPQLSTNQIGDKGTLETVQSSIANILEKDSGNLTPKAREVLTKASADASALAADPNREAVRTAKRAEQVEMQAGQSKLPDSLAKLGDDKNPGGPNEVIKNYIAAQKDATEKLKAYSGSLGDAVKSQKDANAVVSNIVQAHQSISKAAAQMEAEINSGNVTPVQGEQMGIAAKAARGVAANLEASIQPGGSVAQQIGQKLGSNAMGTAMEAANASGAAKNPLTNFSNRLLTGMFAFQVARDIRYTVSPVEQASQQYIQSQQAAQSAIAQTGQSIRTTSIPGYSGSVQAANMASGFSVNANAMMSGLSGALGNNGQAIGQGPLGTLAAVGLPALGAAAVTASAAPAILPLLGASAAAAGPLALGVGAVAAGAGLMSFASGASKDNIGAMRYAYSSQNSGATPWSDVEGALAFSSFNARQVEAPKSDAQIEMDSRMGEMAPDVKDFETGQRDRQVADSKTKIGIDQIKKYGNYDLSKLNDYAKQAAVGQNIPTELANRYGITNDEGKSIANMVYSLRQGGAGTETAINFLAQQQSQGINPQASLQTEQEIAQLSGNLSIDGGISSIYDSMKANVDMTPTKRMQLKANKNALGGYQQAYSRHATFGTDYATEMAQQDALASGNLTGQQQMDYLNQTSMFNEQGGWGLSYEAASNGLGNYEAIGGEMQTSALGMTSDVATKKQGRLSTRISYAKLNRQRAAYGGAALGPAYENAQQQEADEQNTSVQANMTSSLTSSGMFSASDIKKMIQQYAPSQGALYSTAQSTLQAGVQAMASNPQQMIMGNMMTNGYMNPTTMSTTAGQTMMAGITSGNPYAVTAAWQNGGILSSQMQANGPLMDANSGAGLFQRSMYGMPTYSTSGGQSGFFTGSTPSFSQFSTYAGTSATQMAGSMSSSNWWSGMSSSNQQALYGAASGQTFGSDMGGIAGLQQLADNTQWAISQRTLNAGAALQAKSARISHEYAVGGGVFGDWAGSQAMEESQMKMDHASKVGGSVSTPWGTYNAGAGSFEWEQRSINLQKADQEANYSQSQARLGWQLQDVQRDRSRFGVTNQWTMDDINTSYGRSQVQRGWQAQEFQVQGQQLQLQKQYSAEDYSYNKQVRQLNYGWQMEDADTNIRRSTGFQRKQLVKEKERTTQMYNLESGHDDSLRSRELESQKLQEEALKRQIAHWKTMGKWEDEDYAKQKKRWAEETKWKQQDFDTQESRIKQEMAWNQESAARSKESIQIRQEQLDAEKSAEDVNFAMKTDNFKAEKIQEEEKFKLSQIIIGMTKEEQDLLHGTDEAMKTFRKTEQDRLTTMNKLELDMFKALADMLVKLKGILDIPNLGELIDNAYNGAPHSNEGVLPGGASGGTAKSGLKLVGENGPEIINSENGQILPTKYLLPTKSSYDQQPIQMEATVPIQIDGQKFADVMVKFMAKPTQKAARRIINRG